MVHFDRTNCQNQAKILGYKTEYGAKSGIDLEGSLER